MPRTRKKAAPAGQRQRRISVRGVRREPADVRKLSRALIALALAQAEADAQKSANKPGHDVATSEGNSL